MRKLCLFVTLLFSFFIIHAQQHGLDPTFGNNGVVVTTNVSTNSVGTWDKVQILSSGKILALGSPYNQMKLVRYKPNGTIDSAFANNGVFSYPLLGSCSTILHDSTILVGGTINSDNFFLVKLKADGTLDSSFGTNGLAYQFGGDHGVTGISVQTNGRIIVSGTAGDNFAMVRFLANGTPDSSFGLNGRIVTFGGYNLTRCSDITLQPDGKILLAGSGGLTSYANFLVVRYLSDGTIDSSFNGTGRFVWQPGDAGVRSITLQPDGRILLSGGFSSTQYTNGADVVMRLLPNGTVDTSFNHTGFTAMQYPSYSPNGYLSHCSMIRMADGRIQLAGIVEDSNYWKYASMWRCLPDGRVDTSFCINGSQVLTIAQLGSGINSLALQSDGKIVTAGFSNEGNGGLIPHFTLARFMPDGNVKITEIVKPQVDIKVYPNPANNFFTIEATNTISSVRLTGMDGKTYKRIDKPTAHAQFATEDLPNGIYFVLISILGYATLGKTITIMH